MVNVEFTGTRASLIHLTNPPGNMRPHCDLVVSGRTKGNQLSGAKFKIPICGTTECSGLRPGAWATRLCRLMTEVGRTKGHLSALQMWTALNLETAMTCFARHQRRCNKLDLI